MGAYDERLVVGVAVLLAGIVGVVHVLRGVNSYLTRKVG